MHATVPLWLTVYSFPLWNVGVLAGPFVWEPTLVAGSANGVNQSSFPSASLRAQTPSLATSLPPSLTVRVPMPKTLPSATDGVPQPVPRFLAVQASGGPPSGQLLSRPVSVLTSS